MDVVNTSVRDFWKADRDLSNDLRIKLPDDLQVKLCPDIVTKGLNDKCYLSNCAIGGCALALGRDATDETVRLEDLASSAPLATSTAVEHQMQIVPRITLSQSIS